MCERKVSSYNTIGRMSETSVEVGENQQQRGRVSAVLGESKKKKKCMLKSHSLLSNPML